MVGRVEHTSVSQIAKQAACVLAPAVIAAIYATKRPLVLSNREFFFAATVFCPTLFACRWHEWTWKTTLVTSFVLACLAGVISAFVVPPSPLSTPSSPSSPVSSNTNDLTNPNLVFGVGTQINGTQVLNFARVEEAGVLQFVPVVATREHTKATRRDVFKRYDGTPLQQGLLVRKTLHC